MKIGIQTWGSYGDVRPFMALAEGLKVAGHEVTLLITSLDNTAYETTLSTTGVKVQSVASPVIPDKAALSQIEASIFAESDSLKQTQTIIERLFLPVESEMYQAAEKLCRESDLVIGHFFHYPLHIAAERMGCSYVSIALVYSVLPSATVPPSGLPNLGSVGNRILWWLVRSMLNKKVKPYSDRLRVQLGLKPTRDLCADVWSSKQLTLVAVSSQLCKRPKDWPDYYQVCGFLSCPNVSFEADVPKALQDFLSVGEAPIYITFGSVMSVGDQQKAIQLLVDACEKASVRAIIQFADWSKLGVACNNQIHFVESASHTEIFPHCRVIIHHGGAGTSQAAILAGKPSIVVSHTSEQEFWGRELAKVGLAPTPITRQHLTAKQLAAEIIQVIADSRFSETASRIGQQMAKEDGVATAVKLIEQRFSLASK